MSDPSDSHGPTCTPGTTFRARAEALARRFRAEHTQAGYAKYGHLLDDRAITAGANFLHPAAHAAAEARAAKGKGVDRERTFGNMLSSQALCFNLLAPLAQSPEGLERARHVFARFIPSLARVRSIAIEYTPAFEVFRDQSGLAGVDCDALIEFEDAQGKLGVLVVETKFVEPSFSSCGHRGKGQCPDDVQIGGDFSGCAYVRKNGFAYWQRSAEAGSLKLALVSQPSCPFGGPLWQLWTNHTLAHTEALRRGAETAIFAVCAPRGNEALQARSLVDQYKQVATAPDSVAFFALEDLLEALVNACRSDGVWLAWAERMAKRYLVPGPAEAHAPRTSATASSRAVTAGHRHVVAWMASKAFRDLVSAHDVALGQRATIYFRPTDKGLVRIALHPRAPSYVGFHARADDDAHLFSSGSILPTLDELRDHFNSFETWLKGVQRSSDEERGVILWLRNTLTHQLWLPELGDGWVFLHQEWRFIDDAGKGKKSDVLAVHVPTGQLGIVELKSTEAALVAARQQVEDYGRFWGRDSEVLAPVFTELLRAQGAAYGSEVAAKGSVDAGRAALFVGVACGTAPTRVWRHA